MKTELGRAGQEALDWAEKGIPVFPCKNTPGEPGHKRPLTPKCFYAATTDTEQIEAWWTKYSTALIGMPTGAASGYNVIDIDRKNGKPGTKFVPDWEERSPVIAQTVNGGIYLYFKYDEPLACRNGLFEGVDLKADGGYVIVPPSAGYSWRKKFNGADLPTVPLDLRPKPYERCADAPSAPHGANGNEPPPNIDRLRAAVFTIDAGCCRDDWRNVGIALQNELGSDVGWEIFDPWSRTSPEKYAGPRETHKQWLSFAKYPDGPRAGTIFRLAREADPNWENKYWQKIQEEAHANFEWESGEDARTPDQPKPEQPKPDSAKPDSAKPEPKPKQPPSIGPGPAVSLPRQMGNGCGVRGECPAEES
jgi:hypothetical protein